MKQKKANLRCCIHLVFVLDGWLTLNQFSKSIKLSIKLIEESFRSKHKVSEETVSGPHTAELWQMKQWTLASCLKATSAFCWYLSCNPCHVCPFGSYPSFEDDSQTIVMNETADSSKGIQGSKSVWRCRSQSCAPVSLTSTGVYSWKGWVSSKKWQYRYP